MIIDSLLFILGGMWRRIDGTSLVPMWVRQVSLPILVFSTLLVSSLGFNFLLFLTIAIIVSIAMVLGS